MSENLRLCLNTGGRAAYEPHQDCGLRPGVYFESAVSRAVLHLTLNRFGFSSPCVCLIVLLLFGFSRIMAHNPLWRLSFKPPSLFYARQSQNSPRIDKLIR